MKLPKSALAVAAVTCCAFLVVPVQVANAVACGSNTNYRAGDDSEQGNVDKGVRSEVQIPASGTIAGYGSGKPSAVDVFLTNGTNFVQAGWYVGSNGTGLTNVSVPHFFWGEYDASAPGNEHTHTGDALAWGAHYTFEVYEYASGDYEFVYKHNGGTFSEGITADTHPSNMDAAYDGEIDFKCTSVFGLAATSSGESTLTYCTAEKLGTCSLFSDHRYVLANSKGILTSATDGATATDLASGGD